MSAEKCPHVSHRVIKTYSRKTDGVVKRTLVCRVCGATWSDQVRLRAPVRGEAVVHRRIGMPASGAA